ncbi:Hypothetical_protein [Hexamita inflata]|uniref:Hypothetical_protein n=1 Tax=Hexamita inflata TaxID=28002 RepID=A0AA86TIV2_9EUKA|nr:Hypothetical protein HINF_LOCUS6465 [Hexamita inflata]
MSLECQKCSFQFKNLQTQQQTEAVLTGVFTNCQFTINGDIISESTVIRELDTTDLKHFRSQTLKIVSDKITSLGDSDSVIIHTNDLSLTQQVDIRDLWINHSCKLHKFTLLLFPNLEIFSYQNDELINDLLLKKQIPRKNYTKLKEIWQPIEQTANLKRIIVDSLNIHLQQIFLTTVCLEGYE